MELRLDEDYAEAKKYWLEKDGWKELGKEIEIIEAEYQMEPDSTRLVFDQTGEIIRSGHFNDYLAYPVFAIGRLLHQRIGSTDATVSKDDMSFAASAFDRMAAARDLLLAASSLMDGVEEVVPVLKELTERLQRYLPDEDWSPMEYGLLHASGVWHATEEEAVDHFCAMVNNNKAGWGDEYLVARRTRKIQDGDVNKHG